MNFIKKINFSKIYKEEILKNYSEIILVTDTNVYKLYKNSINELKNKFSNIKFLKYVIQAGEIYKNLKTKNNIENFLFENKINRSKSCLLALGGGVVGDITGYVASTYKRGIDYIQIPTTLLAMVDSSIGGKTGINNEYGKNLIGAFYNPKCILYDINFLASLDLDEFKNGLFVNLLI